MGENYSSEFVSFIEKNIGLIEQNTKGGLKKVFHLAKEHGNHFVNEFVELMDSVQIDYLGLDVYKYDKDKNSFYHEKISKELEDIREFLLKHNVCISINIEDEKIIIVGVEQRNSNPICENPRLAKLFKQYSNITLEKAKSYNFKDLIHLVAYHSVNMICAKHEEDMREFRIDQYITEKGDNAEIDYKPDILDKLGCFNRKNNEIWLCDELIQNTAKELSKEYGEKLFGDSSLSYELIEDLLYEKVFTHEFGHLVFDWVGTKNREKKEKQANYFSSYITDGSLDVFISDFTRRQPKEYHNQYLKGDKRAEDLYK